MNIVKPAMLLALVASSCCLNAELDGQTFRRDYIVDAPIHYQAGDPWNRGVIYRIHTSHGGMHYNCDQEECKRYSPYIDYRRANCDCRTSTLDYIRRQVAEVQWRIKTGKCADPGCYPGCQCEPAVNLSCNVQPDSFDLDYSDLNRRLMNMGITPGSQPGPAGGQSKDPTTDFYREPSRPTPQQSKPDQDDSKAPNALNFSDDSFGKIRLHSSIVSGKSDKVAQPKRSTVRTIKFSDPIQGTRKSDKVTQPERSTTRTIKFRDPIQGVSNQQKHKSAVPQSKSMLQQLIRNRNRASQKTFRSSQSQSEPLFSEPPFKSIEYEIQQKRDQSQSRLLRSALIPIERKQIR